MSSDTDDPVHLLLENPDSYNEIESDFEDEATCYEFLRSNAKKSISSFDNYIKFYDICLENGPSPLVYSDLKNNAARSLKNMVLRESKAGKRFPILSATQLQDRIGAYQDIGIDSVTDQAVVFTLLEHIFESDKHEKHAYEILDQLLNEIPTTPTDTVKILVRARFVIATETLDTRTEVFEEYINSFLSDLPDPRPNDDRTASELFQVADKRKYSDPEKIELVCASLARQRNLDALQEFLYLSARDVVERYRHASRNTPWKGELQLAHRQFNCLINLFGEDLSDERKARINSYRYIIKGELKIGDQWQSQLDPNDHRDSNFMSASKQYSRAAEEIKRVDLNRYIKYLSKSFRHCATHVQRKELGPARGWETSRQLHATAPEVIMSIINTNNENDKLLEIAPGIIAFHEFHEHESAAIAAFERTNSDEIQTHVSNAWDCIDNVSIYVRATLLDDASKLSEALQYELARNFGKALDCYNNIESSKLDLKKRIELVKVKKAIIEEDYEEGIKKAETVFGSNSPILAATQIIAGETASAPSIYPPLPEDLSGLDAETKWSFATFVYLISYIENPNPELSSSVKELLMEL